MVSFRLWIIRKSVCVVLLLMADIIFNYGTISCESLRVLENTNSSTETSSEPIQQTFLDEYLHSVFNRTKTLEEVIYSDLLNNLRNLIGIESERSFSRKAKGEQVEGSDVAEGGARKRKQGNKTNAHKGNDFSNSASEFINEKTIRQPSRNVTRVQNSEYLLGYSGNPFGSRRPITGLVQLSESDPTGTGIGDPRKKRSVLHLYNMVLCTTGCNPFAYIGYGCYCGFLGSGFVVDGIDSCCKMHDWCYNTAGCPMFLEYFIPYLWKCYHHQPLCAIDHGPYGGPGSCAQRLCECDRQLALCLRRYPCPSSKALCTSSPWRLLQNVLIF